MNNVDHIGSVMASVLALNQAQVKPKIIKLIFAVSLISTQH
jgi:hypothetical protein